jgi:putative ABC transport system permease protein
MRTLRGWLLRIAGLFHSEQRDRELDAEIESNLELHIADGVRAGMTPGEARRQALVKFGGIEAAKESYRDRRGIPFLESTWQDVRFAVRMLRKSPGFTTIAVLTVALGIGANTAIFSVVDAVLLKPLPYRHPGQLVVVWEADALHANAHNVVSPPNFLDWRAQNHVFEDMAYLADSRVNLTGTGRPEQLDVEYVSANFFDLLGTKRILGHAFTPINGRPGNDDVIVLSYGLWVDKFGSDRSVVGRTIELNGKPETIVGVTPKKFDLFIAEGSLTGEHPQLWQAFAFPPYFHDRSKVGGILTVLARLRRGVTLAQAQSQMDVIAKRLENEYAKQQWDSGVALVPIAEQLVGGVRGALLILLGAVAFVLLVACANVSSLLLSRATVRRREIGLRLALGASRLRIANQLLTESVLLALAGAALGVLLAMWGTNALLHVGSRRFLNLTGVSPDPRVLAFALAITVAAVIAFGFLPSYSIARSPIGDSLEEDRRSSSGRESRSARSALLAFEIATAMILLTGSGLLVRSFVRLIRVYPGFDAGHLLTFKLSLEEPGYKNDASRIAFYSGLLHKLRHIPGVTSASCENLPPFSGFAMRGVATDVTLPGQQGLPLSQLPTAAVRVVGPDYLRTMGIPLLQGRSFAPAELGEAKHVVVVNETFADKFFPKTNPLGQKITIDMKDPNVPSEIIGLIGDVHGADLREAPWPTVYWPYPELAYSQMTILVRTQIAPLSIVPDVREIVSRMDKDVPTSALSSMDRLISNSVAESRFTMLLLSIFAGLTVFLAAIGIYGVMSYSVAQRVNEIGIRMTLGAQPGHVTRLILGQGARVVLIGIAIGVVGAFGLTRFLSSLLFGIRRDDPATFIGVPVALIAIALLACYIPARRAMRVGPMIALRHE